MTSTNVPWQARPELLRIWVSVVGHFQWNMEKIRQSFPLLLHSSGMVCFLSWGCDVMEHFYWWLFEARCVRSMGLHPGIQDTSFSIKFILSDWIYANIQPFSYLLFQRRFHPFKHKTSSCSEKPQAFYDKISQRRSVWRYNRVLRQGLAGAWLVGVPTKGNRPKDERSWVSQKDRLWNGGRLFVFIGSSVVVSNWPCKPNMYIYTQLLSYSEDMLPKRFNDHWTPSPILLQRLTFEGRVTKVVQLQLCTFLDIGMFRLNLKVASN